MGQEHDSKRDANFNNSYVIFFTKYEKDVDITISFYNVIDKFASIKAKKVPL
jgi:predicted RNA-binding protein with TRAM domain